MPGARRDERGDRSRWERIGGSFLSYQKVATRPKENHVAKALRRLTFRQKSHLQCELYFTFKTEASEIKLSELDLRA